MLLVQSRVRFLLREFLGFSLLRTEALGTGSDPAAGSCSWAQGAVKDSAGAARGSRRALLGWAPRAEGAQTDGGAGRPAGIGATLSTLLDECKPV